MKKVPLYLMRAYFIVLGIFVLTSAGYLFSTHSPEFLTVGIPSVIWWIVLSLSYIMYDPNDGVDSNPIRFGCIFGFLCLIFIILIRNDHDFSEASVPARLLLLVLGLHTIIQTFIYGSASNGREHKEGHIF